MPQVEVQVIARPWVTQRIVINAPNAEIAAQQAIETARESPAAWDVPGAKDFTEILIDPEELTDFDTDEITVEE